MAAKDTRRVDVLCYRVCLSQKLLGGTEKFQTLYEIVDKVAKKLEAEVGPLAGLPVRMARGIVNRLSSGPEVQKLCASAVETLDTMLSCTVLHPPPNLRIEDSSLISSNLIKFENVCPTSLTLVLCSKDASSEKLVGYKLWHRKADASDYPTEPTSTLFTPNTRFSVLDLVPSTEYLFKVVSFHDKRELGMCEVRFTTSIAGNNVSKSLVLERNLSPTTNCSSLSNPSSEGDESNNITTYRDQNDCSPGNYFSNCKNTDKTDSAKLSNETIKGISDTKNTSNGTGQEGSPGDSVSGLDEEHVMRELGSLPNSESPRNSTNSTDGNQVSDVLKPENKLSLEGQLVEEMSTENGSNTPRKDMEVVPLLHRSDALLPITPCKLDIGKDGPGRNGRPKPEPLAGSSSRKRNGAKWGDGCAVDGSLEREYEHCVKVIRWLECEGHIEKNFRVKFLTWYSLQANPEERRVVKVFVDTLMDDPACLAGQLVDTFSEAISRKRPLLVPTGFCMKLWH
ncbi:hypothetical protein HHK36_006460 [Tetracentron sinense]|uniref:Fibronectin type-III domain-containing protein n=1 Tax=Tetracentron sinense TaxID=13715 RepID=A0A834ZLK8_TETSI|nr:hypothetical protein HHK36_006460 [Tetracentron sinense]